MSLSIWQIMWFPAYYHNNVMPHYTGMMYSVSIFFLVMMSLVYAVVYGSFAYLSYRLIAWALITYGPVREIETNGRIIFRPALEFYDNSYAPTRIPKTWFIRFKDHRGKERDIEIGFKNFMNLREKTKEDNFPVKVFYKRGFNWHTISWVPKI